MSQEKNKKNIVNQNKTRNTLYIFLLLYVLAVIILFIIFRPFLYALVLGAVLGVFFFPLNKKLIDLGIKKNFSALILVFLIFFLIVSSSIFFINSIVMEATHTYRSFSQYNFSDADEFLENAFGISVSTEQLTLPVIENVNKALSISFMDIIGSITDIVLGLFIMLFLLFYIFKDGENIMNSVMSLIPVSDSHKSQISTESRKILYGVMYGQFLIAIVQGILGGFAFAVFGISNPVFWGFVMAILAFIPLFGTPAVWVPAGIIQIVNGDVFSGVGLLLFGSIVMFTIENIVRPRIIGRRSGMHPLLVLLSIFGGIKLFGVIGLLIGPILVALSFLVIKFFNQELISNQK